MPAYTLARGQVLDDLFSMIKKGDIKFPKWDDTRHFADDFLNVQIEYDEARNTSKYVNIGPDDTVHALCFAMVSLKLQQGVGNLG